MSKTLLQLDQMLLEALGEAHGTWIQHPVTTAIAANTSIISTHLTNYRNTADYFNGWWIYIEDEANIGVSRQISDDDGSNTLTVRGANLTTDGANIATFRLSRYPWATRSRAIIEAVDETYPELYMPFDDHTLITNNVLPNSHFGNWVATTNPYLWAMQDANITAAASTTAGTIRGGSISMKSTTGAAGAGKYVYISSDSYPRLLDLMGKTVDFYCWAYPEVADDPTIQIYTKQADGTEQTTLISTTSCPAGEYTLIELENQVLNDDLVEIQFRLITATASKYVYWDGARASGNMVYEYLLPHGYDYDIDHVEIQTTSDCDDLQPRSWERIRGWEIVGSGYASTGRLHHLRLHDLYPTFRQIRLIGKMPVPEVLSSYDDVFYDDYRSLNKLIAYAKYKLFQLVPGAPAQEDIGRFESAEAKALWEYQRLRGMPPPPSSIRGLHV
jgi:hypothetical protein